HGNCLNSAYVYLTRIIVVGLNNGTGMRAVLFRSHAWASRVVSPRKQISTHAASISTANVMLNCASTYLYALPVRPNGNPVLGPSDWDDYSLWVGAFSARGEGKWAATQEREVREYGLEFRQAGPGGRVLLRFDEPTRSAFHNKVRLFRRLTAARVDCIPPTVFSPSEARKAMAASPPGTVWFYKKAKASRGQGVFPITSLDQLPPEELQEAEAAAAETAKVAEASSAAPAAAVPSAATLEAAASCPSGGASSPTATSGNNSNACSSGSGGIFQQQVPRMLLCADGRKFDLRVLVVVGPGRRAWLHRTLYLRIATAPFSSGADLSRAAQCTNISQGGAVHAVRGGAGGGVGCAGFDLEGESLLPEYDVVLRNVCDATRDVIGATYDILPGPSSEPVAATMTSTTTTVTIPQEAVQHHHKAVQSQPALRQQGDGRDAIHYFGFDYMLDEQLKPWLLEVNSTPRLVNCNNAGTGGAVHEALVEMLYGIVEPYLDGGAAGAVGQHAGGWLPVFP
ncbi:hypothetical protein Agub_g15742, partial [Astrephomene gubernaculifera]